MRRYLLLILLSIITLVSFTAAVHGYQTSMQEAQKFFDSELKSFALTLTTTPLTQATIHINRNTNFAYQIWQRGQLQTKTSNSPAQPISRFKQGYSDRNFSGQRWRTFAYHSPDTDKWTFVAQLSSRRFELAEDMIIAAVSPMIIALPILAFFISMTIKRGLEPLRELALVLHKKKANDFSPIYIGSPPSELAPVIDTLNRMLVRLDNAFIREQRFASDAAHELRTPLSVLQVSIHNLQQELLMQPMDLSPLKLGVERMSHVVEQILLLNRTNPDHFSLNFMPVNLYQLVQGSIAEIYPRIEASKQSIELTGDSTNIQGDSFTLATLIYNLVGNASKYTPTGGEIRVSVEVDNTIRRLQIADSGPGIPDSDIDRVFDRFYRVGGDQHASHVSGCGLGLAIVKQIAQLHHATVEISNKSPLGGLLVQVQFQEPADGNQRS